MSRKPVYTWLFAILSCLILINNSFAGQIVELTDKQDEYALGPHLFYLPKKYKIHTIDDILKNKDKRVFVKNNSHYLVLPGSDSAYWVYFKVKNSSRKTKKWILELAYPYYSSIAIHIQSSKGKMVTRHSGNMQPPGKRDIEHRNFAFNLKLEHNQTYTVFLKIKKRGRVIVPLYIYSYLGFAKEAKFEYLLYGMLFGMLLIMILYNLFLFFSLKDKNYLYYILFTFSFLLWSLPLTGFGYEYIWKDWAFFHDIGPFLLSPVMLFWVLMFARSFLQTKKYTPKIDTALVIYIVIAVLAFVFYLFGEINVIVVGFSNLLNIVILITIFYAAIQSYRKGVKAAKYYIIAWTLFSLANIGFNLIVLGVLPYNAITMQFVPAGYVVKVVLFSLALADRINVERQEKIKAQNEAIFHLEETNKIKSQFVTELEKQVQERTKELNDAMSELETINQNLVEAKDIMDRDMLMAVNVQQNFLPRLAPASQVWDISYYYKPMSGVSGDFYDFYEKDDMLHGLGVFDVSGHGIASGLVTMIAKSIIAKKFFAHLGDDLGEMFNAINRELIADIKETRYYLTGAVLRFNDDAISYVNAGHPDILIKRKDDVSFVYGETDDPKSGTYLGLFDQELAYETVEITIESGEYLILYSDYLIEGRNVDREEFGRKRLKNVVENIRHGTARDVLYALIDEFNYYIDADDPVRDDMTIIVLRKL